MNGTAHFQRHNKYKVQIENGSPTWMSASFNNGAKMECALNNGAVTGHAVITWPSGARYEGYVENGLRNGEGSLVYDNGAKYSGTFVNDNIEGSCVYSMPMGKAVYPVTLLQESQMDS